jgi:hypothetical protein
VVLASDDGTTAGADLNLGIALSDADDGEPVSVAFNGLIVEGAIAHGALSAPGALLAVSATGRWSTAASGDTGTARFLRAHASDGVAAAGARIDLLLLATGVGVA